MASKQEKHCRRRDACIHSRIWPSPLEMPELEPLLQQSAALGIRPCIQLDKANQRYKNTGFNVLSQHTSQSGILMETYRAVIFPAFTGHLVHDLLL